MTKSYSRAFAFGLALALAQPALAKDEPLKVSGQAAVKGAQSVVIGAFNVGFIFESVDNIEAAGGLVGVFAGANRAKSELTGVSPVMMQAITDAAYDDFKAQLIAKGFTVADATPMFLSKEFAKVKPIPVPYDTKVKLDKKQDSNGKSSYYKPGVLPGMVMLPGDVTAAAPSGLMKMGPLAGLSGLSGMGAAMASGTVAYSMANYAKASGQGIIDVTYLIDFSDAKRPGAFSFGGVKVTSGMSVVSEFSRASFVGPNQKTATLLLKQPVAVEGDFAEMQDSTKDKGLQTASNVGAAAIGILGGAGATLSKSRTFTFTAKPGVYEQGAIKAATLANARIVDQLAALR